MKWKGSSGINALAVQSGSEPAMREELRRRSDVQFAELDVVLTRQFAPNDPGFASQWHHEKIHSSSAWSLTLGSSSVTVAIIDTPFQMDHPDLAAHTVPGWSMITGSPITMDTEGYFHSTLAAGIAGAVINNATGTSGMANCQLMPIDIGDEPTASDMHDAIVWAADHGVRVVNLSWDGAFSSVINDAGAYLKQKTGGMLFMSGVNGTNLLNYPDQPDIYAVSMTDTNDVARSSFGDHIDFAAPGWDIYSTTTGSGYETDSGTSYSAPLLAGITAWIMSANPDLGPDQIEQILIASCVDLGAPGRDQHYGWGRIDFGKAAQHTFETLPSSRLDAASAPFFTLRTPLLPGHEYTLLKTISLTSPDWLPVNNALRSTNNGMLYFTDSSAGSSSAFYKIEIDLAP